MHQTGKVDMANMAKWFLFLMYAIYCESEECERGAGLLSVGNISALALKVKQDSTQCSD